MKKSGTKNVVAINESIKNIETLTEQFKRKRLSQDEYVLRVNQNLSKMTDEINYIEYLINIGQY
jgi:acetate kinase